MLYINSNCAGVRDAAFDTLSALARDKKFREIPHAGELLACSRSLAALRQYWVLRPTLR
jgi:hypothetical protein